MKVRASLKKRTADCKIVRRKGASVRNQQEEPQVQATPGVVSNHRTIF